METIGHPHDCTSQLAVTETFAQMKTELILVNYLYLV